MDKDLRGNLIISGGQKKAQSLFESSLRNLAVYKRSNLSASGHNMLKNCQAMQASLNLEWIPERRIPVAKVHF